MLMKKIRQSINSKIKNELENKLKQSNLENRKNVDIEMQEIDKN
jgi:hypothetical protein